MNMFKTNETSATTETYAELNYRMGSKEWDRITSNIFKGRANGIEWAVGEIARLKRAEILAEVIDNSIDLLDWFIESGNTIVVVAGGDFNLCDDVGEIVASGDGLAGLMENLYATYIGL